MGVPALGLDALASSAYGPEAALTILMPLGAIGLARLHWVMGPILLLLAILYVSYRQTIRAYPMDGGGYAVSRENLGTLAALLAAAALMIDYILNVAVGIAAGVGAMTSALPALHPYTLRLSLAILALLTMANLRGTGEASRLWALPTYLFAASFLALLGIGVYRTLVAGGHPQPIVPPPPLQPAGEALGLWLLLRSFASGCTAMTGVEAVSNSVGAFRQPVVKEAHRALTAIVAILGMLLAGIIYVAQPMPSEQRTRPSPGTRACCRSSLAPSLGTAPSTTSRWEACSACFAFPPIPASLAFRASAIASRRMDFCRGHSPPPDIGSFIPLGYSISP